MIVNDSPDLSLLRYLDIEDVSVAEPVFSDGSDRIFFSIKVRGLHLDLGVLTLPLRTWNVTFERGGTTRFVRMSNLLNDPTFEYGTVTSLLGLPVFNVQGTAHGNYSNDGTIIISVPRSAVGSPSVGQSLNVSASTFLNTLGIGLVATDTTPTTAYQVQGSHGCNLYNFSQFGMNGDVPVSSDYNRNGTADFAVWRPNTGTWYTSDSITGAITVQDHGSGVEGDIPVTGHFDNDNKADFTVFRPSTGTWMIHSSETGTVRTVRFGMAEDIPLSGDFDGDRVDDIVVWRPSTGVWYILHTRDDSFNAMQFGMSEDRPFVGDFDGDRVSDVGVYRPSTGIWYTMTTGDYSVQGVKFGWGTDVISPADYDGDGKTDLALWRPENGVWYVLKSSTMAFSYAQWGLSTDIVQPGDYNGNGRADYAVWRPETGVWYVYHN